MMRTESIHTAPGAPKTVQVVRVIDNYETYRLEARTTKIGTRKTWSTFVIAYEYNKEKRNSTQDMFFYERSYKTKIAAEAAGIDAMLEWQRRHDMKGASA